MAQRTAGGRLQMALVLLICAAPVIASYLAYFVIRPDARTNYGELIVPPRALPADLVLRDLDGRAVPATTLKDQWLLVVVSDAACDARCERHLWVQRQLREMAGPDAGRIDKVWLIADAAAPRPETLAAVRAGVPATVLRAPREALARWLAPAAGHSLDEHLYIVDPMGNWMMREPIDADPNKVKRDLQRLLRASSSWDREGR
nr:hypothetical protein [Schlegelella koreensis]